MCSIPAGALVVRYREKSVMRAAFLLASGGALLPALIPDFLTAVVSLFLIGAGMTMLQVTINLLLRGTRGEESFAFNYNLGPLFFGLAPFISPLCYSGLGGNLEGSAPSS